MLCSIFWSIQREFSEVFVDNFLKYLYSIFWSVCGEFLQYLWRLFWSICGTFYEVFMEHIVKYTWSDREVFLEHFLKYLWSTAGLPWLHLMKYSWKLSAVFVEIFWSICGAFLKYLWSRAGLSWSPQDFFLLTFPVLICHTQEPDPVNGGKSFKAFIFNFSSGNENPWKVGRFFGCDTSSLSGVAIVFTFRD